MVYPKKLTLDQELEIFGRVLHGERHIDLAQQFQVSPATISRMINRYQSSANHDSARAAAALYYKKQPPTKNRVTSGGSHRANRAKQPIWFVPVRPVRVIRTFRGGGFPNPVQTKFGHGQTLTKPDFVTTKPNANQLLSSLNHEQTYSEVCSFCVKSCPNQCR
jgi:hypothetical protein